MHPIAEPAGTDPADRPRAVSLICLAAALVALAALTGWLLNRPLLTQLHPGYPRMTPNTAIGFVFMALCLWLLAPLKKPAWHQHLGLSLALLVSTLGLATLSEYLLSFDLQIDTLLVDVRRDGDQEMYPGRMSLEAAVNFSLMGLALATLDWPAFRGVVLAEHLSVIPLGISSLAIIGYLYSEQALYRTASYTPLALPSSLLFVALASAICLARPRRGLMATLTSPAAGGVILRRILPVAIGAPILIGSVRPPWAGTRAVRPGIRAGPLRGGHHGDQHPVPLELGPLLEPG